MTNRSRPASEPERLAALHRYGILDTPPEEVFDRVARLAARLLDAPIALVAFLDEGRQWIKASVGWDQRETSRAHAFFDPDAPGSDVVVVQDAAADARFEGHPLVTGAPGVRFYAGAPLVTPAGHTVGTLCVMDVRPRSIARADALEDLAAVVVDELERRGAPEGVEHALRERERRFRLLFQQNPLPMWVYDLETLRFLSVNAAAVERYGYSEEDFLAMRITDIRPETEIARLRDNLALDRPALEHSGTWTHRAKGGALITVDIASHTVEFMGRPAVLVVARDVTRREEALRALREREEHLATTLDSIGDAVITTGSDGRVTRMNPVAQTLTGWSENEARGRPLRDVFEIHNAQTGEPVANPAERVLREGVTVGLANHTVLTARDGTRYHIADSAAPIRADDGELLGMVLVFRDVSEGYAQRRTLELERERFEMAVVGGNLGLWDSNLETGEATYNARWAAILGYTLDEVERTEAFFDRHTHPEDLARVRAETERHARGEIPYIDVEIRMRRKDGSWCWVLDRGKILEWNADGSPRRMVGTHLDITERKEREEELKHSRARLARAQEIVQLGSWEYDFARRKLFWSDEARRIAGWGPGDAVSYARLLAVVHPADRARVSHAHRRARATAGTLDMEYRIRRLDGGERVVHERGEADIDANGRLLRIVGTVLDITERKRQERRLIEAKEKAEEMSRLQAAFLANMSHEIRTPLASVIGFADLLAGMDLKAPADEFASLIARNGGRLLSTLNSVLDLSQLEAGAMRLRAERVAAAPLVRAVVDEFRHRAAEAGVALALALPSDPTPADLDPTAFQRVARNLIANAVKFTSDEEAPGGRVEVRLSAEVDALTLEVADTGVGIEPSFLPYLFTAFRQESAGDARRFEGSGLGLAITKHLVDLMGGTISVESAKGAGATFTVTLPRTSS